MLNIFPCMIPYAFYVNTHTHIYPYVHVYIFQNEPSMSLYHCATLIIHLLYDFFFIMRAIVYVFLYILFLTHSSPYQKISTVAVVISLCYPTSPLVEANLTICLKARLPISVVYTFSLKPRLLLKTAR